MKQFWVLLVLSSVLYYRQISTTISFPYHFTGLWPSTLQEKVEKYKFALDDHEKPVEIVHLDSAGAPSNNEEGWAFYKVQYDAKGRLTEASFFKANGKPAVGKSVGFSKQTVDYDGGGNSKTTFYNPKGMRVKHPEGGWIDSFESLSP